MKYRIKVRTLNNGKKFYYPQYKKFLFWHYFIEDYLSKQYKKVTFEMTIKRFDSLEEVKKFIQEKKNLLNNKITYIYE